jgi:hypothetical protein
MRRTFQPTARVGGRLDVAFPEATNSGVSCADRSGTVRVKIITAASQQPAKHGDHTGKYLKTCPQIPAYLFREIRRNVSCVHTFKFLILLCDTKNFVQSYRCVKADRLTGHLTFEGSGSTKRLMQWARYCNAQSKTSTEK